MNDNLYDQILRQQRGMEPLPPTPGITTEQLSRRGKYSSKQNPCPICKKAKGCKTLDTGLVMCLRSDSSWSIPGWKYIKPLKNAMGSLWALFNGAYNRPEYIPAPKTETSNITPLTDKQLNGEAVKILKQLGLSTKHREQLRKIGLTDEQIDSQQFKSVDRYQEFNSITINPNFPGMGDRGTLTNSGSGILIPIRNFKGLIIGFQIARDDRNPKYQWLWGSGERRVSSELPLQFKQLTDSRVLNIIEGTLKPLTAAHLHNINVLGAGGVSWHGSKGEFKTVVDSDLFDFYVLNPDTGSKLNGHVMGAYQALYLALKNMGVKLYVRDWGQGEKPKTDKLDIDEITSEIFNEAKIVTYQKWDNQVLENGEISEESWFCKFKLPELENSLGGILKRFYSKFNREKKTEPEKDKSVVDYKNFQKKEKEKKYKYDKKSPKSKAIVLWKPQKLTILSYWPGQLPTFEDWQKSGCPKIIIKSGQRLKFYAESREMGFKHLLDSTPTGHGKSFDAGLIELNTFGIDPNDTDNKTRIFYLSSDHRNPTNATVEANYVDLEARHDGLVYDHSRTTALGNPYVVRAKKNQNPDIPTNCPENGTFQAVSELGIHVYGGKDSPICQTCSLLNHGCPFLQNRRDTLNNERLIRADINSTPNLSSDDIVILDDLNLVNTVQMTVEINDILMMVGKIQMGADSRIFKILRPILVSVYKGLLSVTTEKHKFGISHEEVMKLMPSISDVMKIIIDSYSDDWLKANNVWGNPIWHYDMVNGVPEATKIIGEDYISPSLKDLIKDCYKLLENYSKYINGLQTPQEKQEAIKANVITAWLVALLEAICGNKLINLRIDNGKLIITKRSKRHRNIVNGAGFSIALDATQSKNDYALSLGINPDEILEVSEIKQDTPNLKIITVDGLGTCGKQRRETMQERIDKTISAVMAKHQGQNIGLIDHKSVMANSYQNLTQTKQGYHYRDTRGSNQFLGCQVLIIVGRPCPNLGQVAGEYQTLTGYCPKPDNLIERYGQWVNHKIQAELIQGVGRLRAHLRPGEDLTIYLIADLDEDTKSAIRLAYPTATFTTEDVYGIAPEAASKGVQTMRGIIAAMFTSLKSGVNLTIEQVAEMVGKAKSTITFTLKDRLGMGFKAIKHILVLLLEAINSKTKLSVLSEDCLYIANEYLPGVIADLENGDITPADVVVEMVTTAKAFGDKEFKDILAATPVTTLCKLLGAVAHFVPDTIKQAILSDLNLDGLEVEGC